MAKVIFAFTYDTETKEAVKTGNVPTTVAIKIMQDILIAELTSQKQPAKSTTGETENGAHT
jgi:hypothetical protein